MAERASRRWRVVGLTAALGLALATATAAAGEEAARIPNALLPFDMPSPAELEASPREVVAHWFLWPISADNDPPSRDDYAEALAGERFVWDSKLRARPLPRPQRFTSNWREADAEAEIRLAQAMGVDAFHVLIDKGKRPAQHRPDPPDAIRLLQAAHDLDSGFAVAPVLDCNGCSKPEDHAYWRNNPAADVADFLVGELEAAGLADSAALYRRDGRAVFGAWRMTAAPASWWFEVKAAFAARGLPIDLMCIFNGLGDRGRHDEFDPVCDLWTDWGARTLHQADRDLRAVWGEAAPEPIAAAINQQDYRNRPWDAVPIGSENVGSALLRTTWEAAIRGDTELAHLVTWNDYGEHSAFAPTTATQFAFYDLNAYYIAWFKTGRPPEIERDALYFFHRVHHGPPWTRLFGDEYAEWRNVVELVGFLTEPGTLEIATAAGVVRRDVPAGLQVITAPLPREGRPRFRLLREDAVVIDVTSPFAVEPTGEDGIDLVYRGGGSLRMAHGRDRAASACAETGPAAERSDACLSPALGEPVWMAR